jgi:RNA polymerase sigma-70 factor (ECF subfamily)
VTDADLVARARQGDSAAFGELVNRHRTAVYRAARAAVDSHQEAEDVAQDAFVQAFRRLDGFRGDASFKTWMLTIAWHQAINRRRSLVRVWRRIVEPRDDVEGQETLVSTVAAAGPSPEEAVVQADLARALGREIRALSPKLRDTLLLVQSGSYTYEEIAAMLRVPVGTIKWRVSEARRVIKARLSDRGYDRVVSGR